MLSRKENAVMSAVYGKGIQKETFLISPQELKKDVSEKISLIISMKHELPRQKNC